MSAVQSKQSELEVFARPLQIKMVPLATACSDADWDLPSKPQDRSSSMILHPYPHCACAYAFVRRLGPPYPQAGSA